MYPFKSILVPVDFAESSEQALDLAIDVARRYEASLTLLHCYEIPSYAYGGMSFVGADLLGPVEEAAREQLERELGKVRQRLPAAKAILRRGVPWTEILSGIEEQKPDLVVMGTHGRRGLSRALLGSVAERIVRMSPVPVLIVRGVGQ